MKSDEKIRVLVVDDHQIFRDGIVSLLHCNKRIDVVGVASDGDELMALLPSLLPDVVLLDISMPGKTGIELISDIRNLLPHPKVLLLSMHTHDEYVHSAIKAGANGFLDKQNTSADELGKAIVEVNNGMDYFSGSIVSSIKQGYLQASVPPPQAEVSTLSKREMEILQLVVEGFSNAEIAEKLFIALRTVETHKSNILQKLNLKNSVELVRIAIKNQWVKV